ncbi:hypothetical protein CSV00_13760 [Salmonella enterica subsp. enterica serovar Infantis]|nr:hypothetical protein [Salmonella enterica subsp. enterica serovar Infantis]
MPTVTHVGALPLTAAPPAPPAYGVIFFPPPDCEAAAPAEPKSPPFPPTEVPRLVEVFPAPGAVSEALLPLPPPPLG